MKSFKQYLEENKTYNMVYHGTSLYRFNKLKDNGYNTDLIYFSVNLEGTEMYWRMAVEADELEGIDIETNPPIVLYLSLKELIKNGELQPDWDDMLSAFKQGEINIPPEKVSWEESIEFGGTASFKGNIKNAIKNVKIIK